MKFSLNFLKNFLEIDVTAIELAQLLTMAGMEIEGLEQKGNDWTFDVEVTTNRYDWLSILGIAREAAAVLKTKVKFKIPEISKNKKLKEREIIIEEPRDCPYYIGKIIKGAKPSLRVNELKTYVVNSGITSVDVIVDITNYCMLKWGNPLHAFDNDKIEGNIYVRRAKKDEQFIGIDGKERRLNKINLVIADSKKVIALAGVMGAKNTEVDSSTKNIFLEAAIFSPIIVRRSRREAGIDTEASYRFERMVSSTSLDYASAEAVDLIKELTGGTLSDFGVSGKKPKESQEKIKIDIVSLNNYLGSNIRIREAKKILKNLGFDIDNESKTTLTVLSPLLRFDIKREIDIYEEIARVYGYDKIPSEIPFLTNYESTNILMSQESNKYRFKNKIREQLALFGLREIITYSIENDEELQNLTGIEAVNLINPLRKQENAMRTTLFLGMAKSIKHNLNRGAASLKFFELADLYFKTSNGFSENPSLSLGVSGKLKEFFYLKAAIEELCNYLNISNLKFKEKSIKNFTNSLAIIIDGKNLGFLGKLDEGVRNKLGLKEDIYFAQMRLDLIEDKLREKKYKPFSVYQAVYRDLSISLKKDVSFSLIEKIIKSESKYFNSLSIVDTYSGKNVPQDVSIFTLRVFYQSSERTLTSNEIDFVHGQIRHKISQTQGVELR